MKVVFAGTPAFAQASLQALLHTGGENPAQVVAVLTQPDRPTGRGRRITASPVKELAMAAGVPVLQPTTLNDATVLQSLAELDPDLLVVVAYGLLIPPALLVLPTHGAINVHASLLPRWRGAAPIQRAIEAGDGQTGVSIMQLDSGLDTGDIISQKVWPIAPDTDAGTLEQQLAALGAEALVAALRQIAAGTATRTPQPQDGVTYARKVSSAEAELDWRWPALRLERKIRAFHPRPGCHTLVNGKRLKIALAEVVSEGSIAGEAPVGAGKPGEILAMDSDGILVATGQGLLRLLRVQPAGGRLMPAAALANADWLQVGHRLGPVGNG